MPDATLTRLIRPTNLCLNRRPEKAFTLHPASEHHSLMGVADALAISRATLRNMKQNLLGAFIYNSIGIPVAAGILWPFTGTLLNPVVAGAAMALSSITVVSNANRLLRFKPKE